MHDQPPSDSSALTHDYDAALAFLYGRIDYERSSRGRNNYRFRLRCTEQLFERLGLGDYLFRAAPPSESPSAEKSSVSPHAASDVESLPPSTAQSPKVPIVHIAGTKGKGSTATMVSALLTAAGYRVGLYTSPHLTDLEERFRINGVPCGKQELVALVDQVRPVVDAFDQAGDPVSFFELTTAMAMLHFDGNQCDVIVLEVGLGGRLDSTNVCASTVTAITSIGLDHQHVLGDTVAEIAAEKAGILKPHVPAVCGVSHADALNTISAIANRTQAPLFTKGTAFDVQQHADLGLGSDFCFLPIAEALNDNHDEAPLPQSPDETDDPAASRAPGERYRLALCGEHQVHNAGLAIAITRLLQRAPLDRPLIIPPQAIARALANVQCVGRMERFSIAAPGLPTPAEQTDNQVQIVLDTAHNPDSIAALCRALESGLSPSPTSIAPKTGHTETGDTETERSQVSHVIRRPIVIVFGTSHDKDFSAMATELLGIADQVVCTRYTTNPRAVAVDELLDAFRRCSALGRHELGRHELGRHELAGSTNDTQARPGSKLSQQNEPRLALREAIRSAAPAGTVVICGSFFLAGELRPQLLALPGLQPLRLDALASRQTRPANTVS